ncbi:MAG: Fe-S cluster assembly protein SufD [Myxococcales bacterium]|nr:Fe-S cluster assembly protein SufD [Myxococcales bacterium]
MRGRTFTLAEPYADAAAQLPSASPWIDALRQRAVATLRETGFPGRDEAWKFTRASRLLKTQFTPVIGAPAEISLPRGPYDEGPRLVFVDGVLSPALSTLEQQPHEALQQRVSEILGPADGFLALGLAFLRDAGTVVVPDCSQVGPVHLVHVTTGGARLAAVRHAVSVGVGSDLELHEHFVAAEGADGPSLTSAAIELFLEKGAQVKHVRVVSEGAQGLHVGAVGAHVAADARYALTSAVIGVDLARVEALVKLAAPGADTALTGLTLARDAQHVDHHVLVDHIAPQGTSDQTFRSVLDDQSHSVYTGAVAVRSGAVGTDSNQLHHALLLSDDAVANVRPWLEIDNDDVSCAHGAAIGSLDPDALFYLRQRGLTQLEARSLLTRGFAESSLQAVPEGPVRDWLAARCSAWLGEA